MPYEYIRLTADDRKAIAEQQVRQFESEIFGHELNIARLKATPGDTEVEEAKEQASIDIITKAVQVTAAATALDVAQGAEVGPSK